MKQQRYKSILLGVIFIGGFLFAMPVFASNISFVSSNQSLNENQDFSVNVMLDPQNQNINTVGLDINFPDTLSYVSSNDVNSIIKEWVEYPAVSSDGHTIHFSGIIPGGFSGYIDPFIPNIRRFGLLVTLFFKTSVSGNELISASHIHTYLNDGLGTEVPASSISIDLSVLAGTAVPQKKVSDTEAPLSFVPIIITDPLLYNGKHVVVFSTKDVGSGIDHYEIKEGNNNWVIAQSPYVLMNQQIDDQILVKAVDRSGNERVETIQTSQKANINYMYEFVVVMIVIISLYVIIVFKRWKIIKKNLK